MEILKFKTNEKEGIIKGLTTVTSRASDNFMCFELKDNRYTYYISTCYVNEFQQREENVSEERLKEVVMKFASAELKFESYIKARNEIAELDNFLL